MLTRTPGGGEIFKQYYQWSPVLAEAMNDDDEFKEDVKEMIDGVLELIAKEAE